MGTFALIPARGGSKGIPRKNVRAIAGKPLIAWTIEAALRSARLDAVIVSTEDDEIAAAARDAGARVPFVRPAELASDESAGVEPVLHALALLPQHDAVLLLQATSPLRSTEDIDGLLALVEAEGADSAVSVCEPDIHPTWMYRMAEDGRIEPLMPVAETVRRQDLSPVYALNGAMYFARAGWLKARGGFIGPETIGYLMPRERSIDIDGPLDWQIAELLLAGERPYSVTAASEQALADDGQARGS